MPEKKTCPRCHRLIDTGAKLCPFCTWDQATPYIAPATAAPAVSGANVQARPVAAPPPRRSEAKRRIGTQALVIGAALVILIASFAIGALVNGFTSGRNEKAKKAHGFTEAEAPKPTPTTTSPTSTIADLNLVPATSTETMGSATTLPPLVDADHKYQQGYQGGDATALSSQQYARMTQPAPATPAPAATVNPLAVPPTPAVPATPPPAARPRPAPSREIEPRAERHVERSEAVPISQPLPDIDTSRLMHDANLRFNLTIGPDGRVREVEVIKGSEGITAQVISKIQRWRFKPATENGQPVESNFPVDISFNATR